MEALWRDFYEPEDVDIVAPGGTVRSRVEAYHADNCFIIEDIKVDVRPGDEIRRQLPNGEEDVFLVEDPKLLRAHGFPLFLKVIIRRHDVFPRQSGGNYNFNVWGRQCAS